MQLIWLLENGWVTEWSIVLAWKACVPLPAPGVRIPPHPLLSPLEPLEPLESLEPLEPLEPLAPLEWRSG